MTPLPADIAASAKCSLADAITAANTDTATGGCPAGRGGADEITLTTDHTLTESLPAITSEIYLLGGGHTINGANRYRIFRVSRGGRLHVNNANLSDGKADDGGAIKVENSGKLTPDRQHRAKQQGNQWQWRGNP